MRTLYIECNMGAAGDMLMAALLELHPDPESFIHKMNHLGILKVSLSKETSVKCGITGTHVSVYIGDKEEESHDVSRAHKDDQNPDNEHSHLNFHTHDHLHVHMANTHSHHEKVAHAHTHGEEHHSHSHEVQTADGAQAHISSHLLEQAHENDNADEHEHIADTHVHGEEHHTHTHEAHKHGGEHHHNGIAEIQEILHHLPLSDKVKLDVLAVYGLIAEAESKAHGKPVTVVHFHEVGMMDAVADIVGVCILMEELAPQRIVASPVHVGSGQVRCAHGVLPVPAPATAHILKGVPTYGGKIAGELCTPTGAALLKYFVQDFSDRPQMVTENIGYGMGRKDFEAANCVRVFIGNSKEQDSDVVEIACNLDDMTGEELGFALDILLEEGALDVYMVPVYMKKSRPGQMLVCLCKEDDEEKMAGLMLRHTTTLGVRSRSFRRRTLERSIETTQTNYGPVRVKTSRGCGITKKKAEYEDLAKIAKAHGISILDLKSQLQ